MNILSKISIKNIKLNKKRTISTIVGIILSVALICAVASMATSFQATLVENAVNNTGYWHIKLSNVTEEDIKVLDNNRDIKEGFKVKQVGYAKLDNCKNEDKPYVNVYSMSDATFKNLHFNLLEGRFPANNNEIVISNHIMTNGEVNLKIGDEISLGIGKRIIEGEELDDYNPYLSGEEGEEKEELQVKNIKKFKIVGIIERPNYSFENYSAPSYTVITTNMDEGNTTVYLSLKNPKEYEDATSKILGAKDYKEVKSNKGNFKYDDFSINNELLRWEVFAFSDSTISMIYAVVGVVLFIIVFTSVFCIRNSFAISITEKIKMYGMLASIGATKKQIRKNVIFEGILLGLIGIPIGILSGIFAVFVLIQIVNAILGDVFRGVDGFVMNISMIPIILSVLLGFITIYISSIASAIKASRTSPIEQIRNSSDIKIKAKKLKIPRIIKKVFKIGGVLAYKNLKRSKKKYRTTVVSIAVSIFIFITMNAFITNAFEMSSNYYEDYDFNVEVSGKISNESLNSIKKLNYVDEIFMTYQNRGEYIKITDLTKIDKEFAQVVMLDEEENLDFEEAKRNTANLMIIGLDDETFKSYVKKIGEDYEKIKNKGILCDNYKFYGEDDKLQERRVYTYEKKDIIEGQFEERPVSIEIGAVTTTRPYGWEQTYYHDGYVVVNTNIFNNFKLELSQVCIESSNPEELVTEIKKVDSTLSVANLDSYAKEQRSMTLVIKIFLYGFITVITLIGVTNIFNTITSNMELRQKEFAMLKSVGMTKKEFNRMINLETIFYSTKALVYGILMGILGTFAMYKAFNVKLGSDMYIPLNAIGISIVFVFILVFIIMRYSINKINKQNTIETIRKDNI